MTADIRRDDVKDRVREAADIVQIIGECVELKRAGSRFTGRCPFHAEKTPSFSVNPQGRFFHCFGCGESGDVFSFVMKYHSLTFPEALKQLADRYQIALPEQQLSPAEQQRLKQREQLYRVNEAAASVFSAFLRESPAAAAARRYLARREVPSGVLQAYRLGYAPAPEQGGWSFLLDRLRSQGFSPELIAAAGLAVAKEQGGHYDRFRDRVLFPILDMSGRVVAFGGRILGDGAPKYMNSPESQVFDKSRLLFGLYQHRESIRRLRRALVVEGNFDLLLLAAHGIDNVVAPLGTSLTRQHIKSLGRYCEEAVLLFDGDAAGLKAAMRSVPFFLAERVDARVALLPEGHDPDSLVRAEGTGAVTRLAEHARPLAEFVFDTLAGEHGLTLSGKSRIVHELQPLLKAASDESQRSLMLAHFSEKLGLAAGQLMSVPAAPAVRREEEAAPTAAVDTLRRLPRRERQMCDFLIRCPEFLGELLAAGLEEVVEAPAVLSLVARLKELGTEGRCTADGLFSRLEHPEDRRYVAELLTVVTAGEDTPAGEQEQERQMCDELLSWLLEQRFQRASAELQARIKEAQQRGDHQLLMQLVQQKQEMVRKSVGF